MIKTFLGKPFAFWLEMDRRLKSDPAFDQKDKLLQENMVLLAKVAYYERCIKEMSEFGHLADQHAPK